MTFLARAVLRLEPLLLGVVVSAFWFDDPSRVNYLPLLIPPMLARLILYRRIWVNVTISLPLYLFVALCAVNTWVALQNPASPPFSWGWYVVGRPMMGVALALSIASMVYERGRIQEVLLAVLVLAVLVGALGLTGAQYTSTKSKQLLFLIDHIPQVYNFPGAPGGFNVNEIGGAMAFFAPLAAGVMFYSLRDARAARVRLGASVVGFALLALALFLGQSRLAIIGVVFAVGLLAIILLQNRRWRRIALALIAVFCVVELVIVSGIFAPPTLQPEIAERDETSFSQRLVIWGAAVNIIRDYPLTGVGLNQFRSQRVRENYPVPDFAMRVVPHAHDELLQVGADTGIPGMILFVIWHAGLVVMIWRTWRDGDPLVQVVGLSAGAGLLAHAIFGLADAITLFDRFTWAYWLMVGLVCSAYVLSRRGQTPTPDGVNPAKESTLNA